MRRRGRPPAARQIFDFERAESALPEELLLDTSFVVEALIAAQPLHSQALKFLVRLGQEGVKIRFSSMLELEFAETAFQLALKEKHARDWKRYRHDGRARRRAARLMTEAAQAWEALLGVVAYVRVEVDQVIDQVPLLMRTTAVFTDSSRVARCRELRRRRS